MQRRISRTVSLCRALLSLSVLSSAACAGTPLPEPPDELPKPDFGSFVRDVVTLAGLPDRPPLLLSAGPGAVQANTPVWIINLDSSDAPVQVASDSVGGFRAPPVPASASDRVRVLSRTERQHSAPLDLRTIMADVSDAPLEAAPLPESGLSCFSVTPSPTLVLRKSQGTLRLDNACGVTVDLTRVALRFGDQNLALSAAPARLSAGQQVELDLADSQGPGASERLEIVLIDVQAADGRSGRYAIDVFSALD